jgi:DNA-binding IclR family transcriptional regulator
MGMPIRNKHGAVIAGLGLGIPPDRADDDAFIANSLKELARTVDTINGLVRLRG